MARVLISEAVNAGLEPLGPSLEADLRPELWSDRAALLAGIAGAAGLVVRNQTAVDEGLLVAAGDSLKVVGRLGAGLDNLDLAALRQRGVAVVHGGGLNAAAVAEYVIGSALDLARRLSRSDRELRAGGWTRHSGLELGGRVFGVIGLGKTGAQAARLAGGLGMEVIGHDPVSAAEVEGVRRRSLGEVIRTAFVLTLHVPLTAETRGLIGAAELASMPAGAILINAARGGVVDEDALFEALQSGQLGGAALDVRVNEPPAAGDRFASLPNVLLTAHLAGMTQESQAAIAAHVLAGVRAAIEG